MGLASRAQGARRRRCGAIVDDEQRRDRLATPMRPKGCGGAWASASLALLDNVTTLPASRRLASAQAALATRHILILGQAPSIQQIKNLSVDFVDMVDKVDRTSITSTMSTKSHFYEFETR